MSFKYFEFIYVFFYTYNMTDMKLVDFVTVYITASSSFERVLIHC